MTRFWTDTDRGTGVLHARTGAPDRWDVAVERRWAHAAQVSRSRMALQIRQDIWRAVQQVRGFVPRVFVARDGADLHIIGGGTLFHGRATPALIYRIAEILDNPENRRRWSAHARARTKT